jgi:hypothetical protein
VRGDLGRLELSGAAVPPKRTKPAEMQVRGWGAGQVCVEESYFALDLELLLLLLLLLFWVNQSVPVGPRAETAEVVGGGGERGGGSKKNVSEIAG